MSMIAKTQTEMIIRQLADANSIWPFKNKLLTDEKY